MTSTTIKVPKTTRDRLHRLAAEDGLTLAQEIEKLMDDQRRRPKLSVGGFRSERPWTAEELDEDLRRGLGRR
jgi:hypothetical protein